MWLCSKFHEMFVFKKERWRGVMLELAQTNLKASQINSESSSLASHD